MERLDRKVLAGRETGGTRRMVDLFAWHSVVKEKNE